MKKTLFLVGDYDHEVNRAELVMEEKRLRDAGYEVKSIMDFVCHPETGEVWELPIDAIYKWLRDERVGMVANYFTEGDDPIRVIRLCAGVLNIPVRCSTMITWESGQHEQPSKNWMMRALNFLDRGASFFISKNPQKA